VSADPLSTRAGELETLTGFLDWYRAVVANKVRGLSDGDAARVLTPSGLSPLGVLQHLTWAEALWFRFRFAGESLDLPGTGGDNSPTFVVVPGTAVASVVAAYEEETERSRRIVAAAASLDEVALEESRYGLTSLRWILVHMIEETARHAGHLDLMREQLDGTVGD
jgi:uncharacterized damage-inducible protein DinB